MLEIDCTNLNLKKQMVLDKWGDILKTEMIIRCPREYGDMVASIEKEKTQDEVSVGTKNIPYASYVEYGTDRMIKAHGPHCVWAPVRDWEALRKRGDLKVEGGVTMEVGQTMPFARSASFFTEEERMNVLKEAFH
jgi:hypothetical protein